MGFQKLIKEIKNDPLFNRLTASETEAIRHKIPGARVAKSKTIPLDPTITSSGDTLEVGSRIFPD